MVLREHLVQWCWQAAEHGGLTCLDPQYLAQRHRVPLLEVTRFLPNRTFALLLLIDDVLSRVEIVPINGIPPEDYLFDGFMMCFDTAYLHRCAIAKIWSELHWHPIESLSAIPSFTKIINKMVDQAFPDMPWYLQPLTYKAYQALFVDVFMTWLDDPTPDLAKTMAKLDQGLKRISSYCSFFL